MALCPHLANVTVAGTSLPWANFIDNLLANTTETSYLRPNTGGALLPWIYTLVVIILHLPVVVVRVVRWEWCQSWCIATAFFTVLLYVQSYVSTAFAPDQILVWTPLLLVIDAGAMSQIFFLIIEARKLRRVAEERQATEEQRAVEERRTVEERRAAEERQTAEQHQTTEEQRAVEQRYIAEQQRALEQQRGAEQQRPAAQLHTIELSVLTRPLSEMMSNAENADIPLESSRLRSRTPTIPPKPLPKVRTIEVEPRNAGAHPPDNPRNPDAPADPGGAISGIPRWLRHENYALVSSALLFIAVVVLQILGLVYAARAVLSADAPPAVSWCSPLFQPFGLAVVDRDCHVFAVSEHSKKGIGCIVLPGVWQRHWLTGTVVGTGIELVVEVVDLLILGLVHGSRRWRGVKMKRPWTSIFAGVVVLFVTLDRGIHYASTPPPGITEQVTVVIDVQGPASYVGHLMTAGLRGAIIGWSDGLFSSWEDTYLGSLIS